MNTRIYEYIIAVAEEGTVTKAAQRCFISQPALSQHIKTLEKTYGFSLFEKKGNALIPTRQGEIFLSTAKRMLQVEREILQEIERHKQSVPALCRVFTDIHMRNILLDQIIPDFSALYPHVRLSILSGDTETALEFVENGLADIAFIPICGSCPSKVASIPIEQNQYMLLLPPGHPCAEIFRQNGVRFELLQQETFLLNSNHSLFRTMQDQILLRYGIKPEKTVSAHSMTRLAFLVQEGKGVSLLPDSILAASKVRCPAFPLDPPWRFRHIAAYRRSDGLDPAEACLADLFIRHYQHLSAK